MRLNKPIVAVSAAALLTLAACGGSGGSGAPVGAEDSIRQIGAGEGKDANRQAPAAEIDGAQTGGTVKVISIAGLNTMDPTEAYYTNTASILEGLVTRSLTQYVYDPETEDMVLVPDIATDLGTPNDDFTEWKFTIREGVRWETGDEVTPEDVAYGIMRSFDRTTFPTGAAYTNDFFLDGDTYEGPYISGTDYKGIEIDGQTLTLKMATPFPDMPYWGAFPAIGPIPANKQDSDPAKYALHPLATGPYMFDEYTPEKSLTLVQNPEWDPATDPGRHQYVDGYDMEFDVPTAKINAIMLQDEPGTMTYDNITSTDYLQFTQDAPDRLVTGPDPCTYMWYPDYREVKDIDVRRAIAYAYPYKDTWTARGYIEDVTRVPGSNIMPPGIPGREEYNPLPDHEPASTDTDAAKKLLEQADAVGFELKFPYATDDPLRVAEKDVIVASLEKAGFKATPVASTVEEISTLNADPEADINVRSSGWCSDWPTGGSWFPPVFQTTNLDKEGTGSNYAVFSEQAVDDEITRILELDIADQAAAWNELDMTIQEKYLPVIVTAYGGAAMMRGSNINGFFDDPTFSMPTWKDIWLTQ